MRLYRFDMKRCYRRCGQAVAAAGAGGGPSNDDDDEDDDEDEDARSEEEEEEDEEEEDEGNQEGQREEDSDSDDGLGGGLHQAMQKQQQGPLRAANPGKNSMNAGGYNWGTRASATADDWSNVDYDLDNARTRDERDDQVLDDCTPIGPDGDPDDDANAPPDITDLNGIALRLCVTGFGDAQEATKASLTKCNIVKIAAIGYNMFNAGLTLQATIGLPGNPPEKHLFVPMYMSIAPNQVDDKRDLSLLYQLIGRGFVDTKDEELPTDWKLSLLATANTRNLCKLYGNVELLLGQVQNESLEGRKMALGALLRAIKVPPGIRPYEAVYNYALRGKGGQKTLILNMIECLGIQDLDADEDTTKGEYLRLDRPFHNVRDCLAGRYAPDLPEDVGASDQRREWARELFYRGRVHHQPDLDGDPLPRRRRLLPVSAHGKGRAGVAGRGPQRAREGPGVSLVNSDLFRQLRELGIRAHSWV